MVIKVSTLLEHNTILVTDTAPALGGPLTTNNFPIENGGSPVTITGNAYPITTGAAGQVLTTDGFGTLYWSNAGTGTVTSVGVSSIGAYASSLTIGSSPVTGAGTITITPNLFTSTLAGIVPASGGGTTTFLRADGTWATPPGGGGSASNILGGAANEIVYQTAPGVTGFLPAPVSPSTYLEWNGTNFVWAPAGSGSGSVTSVGLTSTGGSITVTGASPITTSGTFNIDLPNSGILAASYGSASAVGSFTVNAKGILTAASSIPISIAPSQAGLGNVINSLQVVNAGGAPSILEGTGVPVSAATIGALYVDRSIANGNSIYFYNGAVWTPITQFLKLYAENSSVFTTPVASATNSIALGDGAQTASGAVDSLAIGNQSLARTQGGVVQASGRFATTGDAQTGRYLLRSNTINAFPTELFIDGTAGSVRLVLPDDCTWTYKITVTGHRTDIQDGHAGFTVDGVIYRASGAATTALQGKPNKVVLSRSNPAWDINISADSTHGSLSITVTGETGKTIRWLALVETVEVTN